MVRIVSLDLQWLARKADRRQEFIDGHISPLPGVNYVIVARPLAQKITSKFSACRCSLKLEINTLFATFRTQAHPLGIVDDAFPNTVANAPLLGDV